MVKFQEISFHLVLEKFPFFYFFHLQLTCHQIFLKNTFFSSFSSIQISDDYRTKNHPSYLSLRKIERYQSDIFQYGGSSGSQLDSSSKNPSSNLASRQLFSLFFPLIVTHNCESTGEKIPSNSILIEA